MLPMLTIVQLRHGNDEVVSTRVVSTLDLMSHTSTRFLPQMERSQDFAPEDSLQLHLYDIDLVSDAETASARARAVFDAIMDIVNDRDARSLHNDILGDLIHAADYLRMGCLLESLLRHIQWHTMSLAQTVVTLVPLLRLQPEVDCTAALAALHRDASIQAAASDEWPSLVPLADTLCMLHPDLPSAFACVLSKTAPACAQLHPHARLLNAMLLALMLASPHLRPDAAEPTAAALEHFCESVSPCHLPAMRDICAHLMGCGTQPAIAAAATLSRHFWGGQLLVSGLRSPARVYPACPADAVTWADLVANRTYGLQLGPSAMRIVCRVAGPQPMALASDGFDATTTRVSLAHAAGVHDFWIRLRHKPADPFAHAQLTLHRRLWLAPGAACRYVTLRVTSHLVLKPGEKDMVPLLTAGGAGQRGVQDWGLRAEDLRGGGAAAAAAWDAEELLLWDDMCQAMTDDVTGGVVVCMDIAVGITR